MGRHRSTELIEEERAPRAAEPSAPEPLEELAPPATGAELILQLQRTAGNGAVNRLLRETAAAEEETKESAGGLDRAQAERDAQALKGDERSATGIRIPITLDLLAMFKGGNEVHAKGSQPGSTWWDKVTKGYKDEKIVGKPFVRRGGRGFSGDKDEIDPNDVEQGALGDCYLLSAMAAIARANPDAIRKLIKDNGDDTYDVTIYEKAHWWSNEMEPTVVKVDSVFPKTKGGQPAFAHAGDTGADGPELWVMLIEKAYAKTHGGYSDIEGGLGGPAMQALTGKASTDLSLSGSDDDVAKRIDDAMKAGAAVTCGTKSEGDLTIVDAALVGMLKAQGQNVVMGHEYSVRHVDPGTRMIELQNPWGGNTDLKLPMMTFRALFDELSSNPTK